MGKKKYPKKEMMKCSENEDSDDEDKRVSKW
jgi:hypothetical protein